MKLEKNLPNELLDFISPILAQAKNGITITDPSLEDNPLIYVNDSFCKTYGYKYDEVIGKNCRFLQKNDTNQKAVKDIKKAISKKETITRVLRNYTKDDNLIYTEVTITPIFNEYKKLKYFLGVQKNITDEYKFREQMRISHSLAKIGTWELNLLENELYWSEEIFNLFEMDKNRFAASYEAFLNAIHPDDREKVNEAYLNSLDTQKEYKIQHRLLMKDGRIKYVEERCKSYFDNDGNAIKSVGTVQDITNLKKIEIELKKTLSFLKSYKQVMDESSLVSKSDLKGNITYVNDNFCKVSKYTREEVIGRPHNIIRHPDIPKELFADLWQTIQSKKIWKNILKNKDKYGGSYWVNTTIMPILNENDEIEEYIAVRHDITKTIEQQNKLDNMLNTDQLTGLGNRYKLLNDINDSINPAIAIINLDSFSQINDFFGHETGDYIIKEFGKKLFEAKKCDICKVYHLQGDEFVILNENVKKEEFINEILELENKLKEITIVVDSEPINLNFTIAISFEEKEKILTTTNMALKIAKLHNKSFIIYEDSISLYGEYENNTKWTRIIKSAIQEDSIVPVFQPIVNNKTMQYDKYESLVRIEKEGKLISPLFFLSISKKTRHYTSITKIIIEKSFNKFRELTKELSINLTIEDILNNSIKNFIIEMLEKYEIGSKVVFEIVESESIENFEKVIEFINIVKSYNCKIAIDDFGTGYSNFQYLVKLNADFIKIDGSLIKDIDSNKTSEIVVKNLVSFAKDLGMKTIAEFVENESILNKVKELGIDYSQGYYFSEPKKEI